MPTSSRRSSSPLILIVLLILVGLWLVYKPVEQQHHDPTATPHVVAARGNLAADEQNTIDVFKNVSPAVVYITSIALRHDLFSLNAIEIPPRNRFRVYLG